MYKEIFFKNVNLRAQEAAEAALKCFLRKRQPESTKPESHYLRFGISEEGFVLGKKIDKGQE